MKTARWFSLTRMLGFHSVCSLTPRAKRIRICIPLLRAATWTNAASRSSWPRAARPGPRITASARSLTLTYSTFPLLPTLRMAEMRQRLQPGSYAARSMWRRQDWRSEARRCTGETRAGCHRCRPHSAGRRHNHVSPAGILRRTGAATRRRMARMSKAMGSEIVSTPARVYNPGLTGLPLAERPGINRADT